MTSLFKLTEGEFAESIGVERATDKDKEGEEGPLCAPSTPKLPYEGDFQRLADAGASLVYLKKKESELRVIPCGNRQTHRRRTGPGRGKADGNNVPQVAPSTVGRQGDGGGERIKMLGRQPGPTPNAEQCRGYQEAFQERRMQAIGNGTFCKGVADRDTCYSYEGFQKHFETCERAQ
ncbi:uncharacterized protein FFB20_13043 [Fusarium fujikuroi]|uniref:Uncharacterized protein n=2 Tax=Fusarium fujikuroi TaxID=5127 RepID=S0DHM4_GIBF5|nr:uncharacterized protein FFUJ_01797 [Fusarium fujikuroi IMI 58289]KLP01937.1 uncharacterized protein Y057_8883 [Fusarium fujikuroi]KLP20736.1 uncharacterized protein LW94_12348 [Fusarium fujikuroi]CCT61719.1 uncharacterized protein FFUJ_01797 [Fusarium fujikuroi IMI 58289]SCN73948.1 uncharacterized protein FFC1_01920 [Fusarium fujikuroi]SCO08424.1 uncharacterized protein FFB20_13043 [Fusarium fujikuroi]